MARLSQEMLFAACRAIYEMAGKNYVLPPLIRDAGNPATKPSYTYSCRLGTDELYFLVALDEAYADRNTFADAKLPLKFHAELRDPALDHLVEISESDTYELIRAFLLGVKVPILADKIDESSPYKLSVQLSSTFFVDCGELSDECTDFSELICDKVGQKIYERSKEFFDDRQQGLAVWSLRAAQGLFGEARPAPETFWPDLPRHNLGTAREKVAIAPPVDRSPNDQVKTQRSPYAVAATILVGLLGTGVVAANFGFLGVALSPPGSVAKSQEISLAALRRERALLAAAKTSGIVASIRTSAEPVPLLGAQKQRLSDAQLRQAALPAVALRPRHAYVQIASAEQSEPSACGNDQAKLAAFLLTPAPISPTNIETLHSAREPAPHLQPKRERSLVSRPAWRYRHRPVKRFARTTRFRRPDPLAFTRNALASLNGVVKGIKRIPGEIVKATRQL